VSVTSENGDAFLIEYEGALFPKQLFAVQIKGRQHEGGRLKSFVFCHLKKATAVKRQEFFTKLHEKSPASDRQISLWVAVLRWEKLS
jgi:hypothetical protein